MEKSKDFYKALFHQLGTGILVQDIEGTVIDANSAAAEIFNIPLEKLLLLKIDYAASRTFNENGLPLKAHEHPGMIAMRTGESVLGFIMGIKGTNDTQAWWVRVDAHPQFFEGTSEIYGAVSVISEVTEQDFEKVELRHKSFVVDAAATPIIIGDLNGNIVYSNKAFIDAWGYESKKDIRGRNVSDFWDMQITIDIVRKVLGGGKVIKGERLATRADGSQFPIHITTSMIFDKERKTERLLASILDLTDEKKAISELEKSREFLNQVINSVPQFIFWKDRNSVYQGCNKNFAKVSGLNSASEIIGLRDNDLYWGKTAGAGYRQNDLEVMDSGESKLHFVESQQQSDGRSAWIDLCKIPLFENGEVSGILGTYEDITERIEYQNKLKRLQNFLSNIINSMPSVLIGLDERSRITQWNDKAEALFGMQSASVLGKKLKEVTTGQHAYEEAFTLSMDTESVVSLPPALIKRGAEKRYEEVTVFPVTGEVLKGVVIRIDDVTHREKMKNEAVHSQKMEAVGKLAGGVAHDLNNMLGGIIGAAELLKVKVLGDSEGEEFLSMILEASARAGKLINQLLLFSRKQKVEVTAVDIHEMIYQTRLLMKNTVDKRIDIDLDMTAPFSFVMGDSAELQNMVLNLGINACHAMPDGGRLLFKTKGVDLDEAFCVSSSFDLSPGEYVEIKVQDSGTGIDPDDLPQIFDPFFTTKAQGQGTGLGLSAVYGTIQNYHGAIKVYSEVGVGTNFTIYFPIVHDSDAIEVKRTETLISGFGTILVIDDEKVMQKTAKAMLERLGYSVLLADDGAAGVSAFRENMEDIDLVIVDMIMPKMNGKDCFLELRKMKKDIPVIVASGFSRDEDLDEMRNSGINDFIQKPYMTAELSIMISKILSP